MEALITGQRNHIGSKPEEAFQDISALEIERVQIHNVWELASGLIMVRVFADSRESLERAEQVIRHLASVETTDMSLVTKSVEVGPHSPRS